MKKFMLLVFLSFITQANAKDLIDYASVGDYDSVSILLTIGADPNIERDGTTPLKEAIVKCPYSKADVNTCNKIASAVMRKGAIRNQIYENGFTLPMLLIEYSKILTNCNVIDTVTSSDCNAMMYIILASSKDGIYTEPVDFNKHDIHGHSFLNLLVGKYDQLLNYDRVLSKGFINLIHRFNIPRLTSNLIVMNPNVVNNDAKTPLMFVRNLAELNMLLDYYNVGLNESSRGIDIDINASDNEGNTALFYYLESVYIDNDEKIAMIKKLLHVNGINGALALELDKVVGNGKTQGELIKGFYANQYKNNFNY